MKSFERSILTWSKAGLSDSMSLSKYCTKNERSFFVQSIL